MGRCVEKPYCNGTLSAAGKKSFVIAALRRPIWKPRNTAIEEACVGRRINKKTGRMCKHYECAMCHKEFVKKQVVGDHISPVVDPEVGFVDYNTWIERHFIENDGYQCLCIPCHGIKTNREKAIAKERRRK